MSKKLSDVEKVRRKWLRALRSGKYQQTTNRLHDSEGFCCLGVLCDLAVKEGVLSPPKKKKDGDRTVYSYAKHAQTLPHKVQKWAGMGDEVGSFKNYHTETLAQVNDEGKSFSEIADIIESNPKGLFKEEK